MAPKRRLTCAAVLLAMASVPWAGAGADQTDPRLAGLFDQLRTAPDQEAAGAVEAQIWSIWSASGRADVDGPMQAGATRMAAGDNEGALAAFDQVVKIAPAFAEGWNKRATVLYLLGRPAESVADIGRVLALEPRHFGALSGLGLCDAQLGRDRAALDAFERAASVNPNSAGLRLNIEALRKQIAEHSI